MIPIGIGALIVPPLVEQGNNLIQNLPSYATDVQEFADKNEQLRELEADYNITEKLQEQAERLPARIGDAANVLGNIGLGVVNSLFAMFTILVLAAFLLGSGRTWINRALELRPAGEAQRLRVAFDHMGRAVGGYVGGMLAQATVAAITSYIVLSILGVPFAAALAIIIFFSDLVPLVGATIGALLVGIVTLFSDFPTATIVWVIYAVVYQQLENNFIQPQIQKRAVERAPVHRARRRAVRLDAARRPRRARGDPGRGVDPDRDPRVVGLAPRSRPRGPDRAEAAARAGGRRLSSNGGMNGGL